MPYPFAHPAAVLPLIGPMGRSAVPSALVIGSIVPDLWYFVPLATREASHSAAGLLLFCVPVGLFLYVVFHLLLKQPLVALLPARLAPFAAQGMPPRPWRAVLSCLLVGAATHLAWDSFTHEEGRIVEAFPALQAQLFALGAYPVRGFQLLQHASTLLGTAFVGWWTWRAFNRLPAVAADTEVLSPGTRLRIIAALVTASAGWAAAEASLPASLDPVALRHALRSAGLAGAEALGVGLFAYCALMTWLRGRSRAPRSPAGR
jgi:hypothetical protein